jgi:hypothetical protein
MHGGALGSADPAARPTQQCQHPRLFRMNPPVVMARRLAAHLRSGFEASARLAGARTCAL